MEQVKGVDIRELRLGNWVENYHGYFQKVDQAVISGGQGGISNSGTPYYYFYPIPLTPSILEKAGLKKDAKNNWRKTLKRGKYFTFLCGNSIWFKRKVKDDAFAIYLINIHSIPIIYLHQLQNVYFALLGQELDIDLNQ